MRADRLNRGRLLPGAHPVPEKATVSPALLKNLSVNNVYGQIHLSERDDGCSQVVEDNKAAIKFLVSHEQLAKAIKPTMRHFNDPALGFFCGITLEFAGLLPLQS